MWADGRSVGICSARVYLRGFVFGQWPMSYCDEGFIIFLTQRQFAMARNVGVGGLWLLMWSFA
jgi:hypothetical protein